MLVSNDPGRWRKHLPYLVGLLNKNAAPLATFNKEDEKKIVDYWKRVSPRMNSIVSGIQANYVSTTGSSTYKKTDGPISRPRVSEEMLNWFVDFGEEGKFGDEYRSVLEYSVQRQEHRSQEHKSKQ